MINCDCGLKKNIEHKIRELKLLNEVNSKKGHMWDIYGGSDLMDQIDEQIKLLQSFLDNPHDY